MTATTVATVFYGWAARTLNAKLVQVKDEYDIPLVENSRRFAKREFSLFDIERITHLFLNRGIIDYRRFHSAIQILTCMARNYDLV